MPLIKFNGLIAIFICCVVYVPICYAEEQVLPSDQFDQDLKLLDRLKIANTPEYDSVVSDLLSNKAFLSPHQKEELSYLLIFKKIRAGKYTEAITALEEIHDKSQSLKVKIRSRLSLSNLYAFKGEYEKAFKSLKFVSQHIDEIQDKDLRLVVYLAIANTYILTNQYEMGMKFASLLIKESTDSVFNCRGKAYYYTAAIKEGSENYSETDVLDAIDFCENIGQLTIAQYLKVGWLAHQVSLYSEADGLDFLKQILQELKEFDAAENTQIIKSVQLMGESLKAEVLWLMKRYEEAEEVAMSVISAPQALGDNEPRIAALEVLKNIADVRNETEKAYQYLSQLSDIKTAFSRENQLKQMAFLNVEHANLAQLLEIEQLNKANKVLKVSQKLAQQKAVNQKLIVLMLLFLLLVLAYVLYRMKKRHDELESIAEMDHLTKVLNRKGFEVQMKTLLDEAKSEDYELHLAILDLDYFKRVNDEYGHLTGDWILKHVIYEVKKFLDSKMIIGRLGGEEFGILGKQMGSRDMDSRIEQIRRSIDSLDCTPSGHDIHITASFGVTSSELSGHTMQMMLAHADLALYQAKSRGRNRMVRYHYLS